MITRPITRSIRRSITRAINNPYGAVTDSWTPLELFKSGEKGIWYDPSDLSTLYQDAAGTIPVTADGDPVGLMLDKSGNGNHATQSTSSYRPVYRRGDSRGVVNLISGSESAAGLYLSLGASRTNYSGDYPEGAGGAIKLTEGMSLGRQSTRHSIKGVKVGAVYNLSLLAFPLERSVLHIGFNSTSRFLKVDLLNNTYNKGFSLIDVEIVSVGGGWVSISCNVPAETYTTLDLGVQLDLSDTSLLGQEYQGDGVSGLVVTKIQFTKGAERKAYQRNGSHLGGVATGTEGDLEWLEYDTVDDELLVPLTEMIGATVSYANSDGVTLTHPNNIPTGTYTLERVDAHGFDYARVIVDRELTLKEQSEVIAYLEGKA